MIFRKSDVRKRGKTRGWELMLSYSILDGVTTGFAKGTDSSNMKEVLRHIKACVAEIDHPLLLPIITLSQELSARNEQRQRDAREWLQKLEGALMMRQSDEDDAYFNGAVIDLDMISRDLAMCQSQVLWRRPEAWQKIVRGFKDAMEVFWATCHAERKDMALEKIHSTMLSRLRFYEDKLDGIHNYIYITMERLNIQRNMVSLPTRTFSHCETVLRRERKTKRTGANSCHVAACHCRPERQQGQLGSGRSAKTLST